MSLLAFNLDYLIKNEILLLKLLPIFVLRDIRPLLPIIVLFPGTAQCGFL